MKQDTEQTKNGLVARTPRLTPLETAIVQTIAYVDVFNFPLTVAEIHRYLIGMKATRADVEAALSAPPLAAYLVHDQGHFALPGRSSAFEHRRKNEEASRRLWMEARRYGRLIAHLPFVRMIAVTGSLAVDNAGDDADIDFLIVTATGRLWVCRALVIGIVRWAARRHVTLCPNYFLAEHTLTFQNQNLYTAREVAQMVPLYGHGAYDALRRANRWTDQFLPNAGAPPIPIQTPLNATSRLQRAAEAVLRSPFGSTLERWEMKRKIRRLTPAGAAVDETDYCADWCKGHVDSHGQRILYAYDKRLGRQ